MAVYYSQGLYISCSKGRLRMYQGYTASGKERPPWGGTYGDGGTAKLVTRSPTLHNGTAAPGPASQAPAVLQDPDDSPVETTISAGRSRAAAPVRHLLDRWKFGGADRGQVLGCLDSEPNRLSLGRCNCYPGTLPAEQRTRQGRLCQAGVQGGHRQKGHYRQVQALRASLARLDALLLKQHAGLPTTVFTLLLPHKTAFGETILCTAGLLGLCTSYSLGAHSFCLQEMGWHFQADCIYCG